MIWMWRRIEEEWSSVLQTISGNRTVPLMERFTINALDDFKGCHVCNKLVFTISEIDMNRTILEQSFPLVRET